MVVIKRDGSIEEFQRQKICIAIYKAMKYSLGEIDIDCVTTISKKIEELFDLGEISTVREIEDKVFYMLIEYGHENVAKEYEGYRVIQAFKKQCNTTDDSILGLIKNTNDKLMKENSNKNAVVNSTQRDLIAGEVSKDISRRILLPAHIVQAHDNGILHMHDMDYLAQPMINCCVFNLKDMLDNGTVINGKMIESPRSFQKACTIMTQIMAQVASGQYGGQSVNVKHLGKYLRRTYDKAYDKYLKLTNDSYTATVLAEDHMMEELKNGVQTIQYQINTLATSNGQAPFATLFLEIEEGHPYEKEIALIVEEIIRQRLQGIKNEKGFYITPSFPKLVYVLDEHNCLKGGKYDYITRLANECSAKRMYPDYISAKKMKEVHEGNIVPPMGCRSFLSEWVDIDNSYKYEGRFNMGVVSLNLPQIAIIADKDFDKFWSLLDLRLELCYEALMCRYNLLKGTKSDVSPIHWQHGALARLKKGETIDKLLDNGYATISLGYVGLYETVKLMTGKSHTEEPEFAKQVLQKLRDKCDEWKAKTGLGFGLYGTPAESLAGRFAEIDRSKFGDIEGITDKGFYTNSYHVFVGEPISAFDKLKFESQFQEISTGGCISYIEIPNMFHNMAALNHLTTFIYDNIMYGEFNTKSDFCQVCNFEGEMTMNEEYKWVCPNCGNDDFNKMNVVRRTCGYLGENDFSIGRKKDILNRVVHTENCM